MTHHQFTPSSALVFTRLFAALLVLALAAASGCGGESKLTSSIDSDSGLSGDDSGNDGGDAGFDADPDALPGDVGGDDGGDTDTGEVDPCLETTAQAAADFADDYANALCTRLLSCSQNPKVAEFVSFGGWSSVARCAESVRAGVVSAGQAEQAASEGSLVLDSCKAGECLALLPTLDCLGIHRALTEVRYTEMTACYDAFHGSRASGTSCTVDAQCEGEQVCARQTDAASCTGTCTDAGQSGSGQCGDIVCAADQYCQADNTICMTRHAVGEACEEQYECTLDTYCNAGTCTAISSGRSQGESCNGQDAICSLDLACLNGQCTTFLSEGASCQFFGCDGNLFCNQDGQCEARRSGGASCQTDQQCASFRCAGGTCAALDALCP